MKNSEFEIRTKEKKTGTITTNLLDRGFSWVEEKNLYLKIKIKLILTCFLNGKIAVRVPYRSLPGSLLFRVFTNYVSLYRQFGAFLQMTLHKLFYKNVKVALQKLFWIMLSTTWCSYENITANNYNRKTWKNVTLSMTLFRCFKC